MNERGSALIMALVMVVIVGIVGAAMSYRLAQVADKRASSSRSKDLDVVRKHVASRLNCAKTMVTADCKNEIGLPRNTCTSKTIDVIDEQDPTKTNDDVAFIKKNGSMLTPSLKARACCSQGKLLIEVARVGPGGALAPDPLTKKLAFNQGTKSYSGWTHLYPGALPSPPSEEVSPCDLDHPLDIAYVTTPIKGPNLIRCISYYAQLGGWEELYFGYEGSVSCPAGYKPVGEAIDCSKITVSPWYPSAGNQWHEGSYSAGAQIKPDGTGTGFCCQAVNAIPAPPFLQYKDRFKMICQKS